MIKTIAILKTAFAIAVGLSVAVTLSAQTHVPLPDPIPGLIPESPIRVGLQPIASGFVSPTWGTFAPGDPQHLYIVDQAGQLYEIGIGLNQQSPRLLLDVTDKLVSLMPFYDERGFLGLAFHPRFRQNGLLYTFTSEVVNGKADFSTLPNGVTPNAQTVIREWHVTFSNLLIGGVGGTPDPSFTIDRASSRELMRIDKPQFNHNGGTLAFGPDGMLYISLGDGGQANDVGVGHVPGGNAQSFATGNVLGKILRIDPLGNNSGNGKYGIPRDNPFSLITGGAPEIWAHGFRNPFRISFDTGTGDLYVADVGQNNIEEIDIVHKGLNYGWPIKEGTFLFDNGASRPAPNQGLGFVYFDSLRSPAGLIDPIAEYDHTDGPPPAPEAREAIVGGFLYRGHELRAFRGRYFFGDYTGQGRSPNGHLFALNGGTVEDVQVAGRTPLGLAVLGFAQDQQGEIYLLANQTGSPRGRTGQVFKIVEAAFTGHF